MILPCFLKRFTALLCACLLLPLCALAEDRDYSALDAEVAKKFGAFRTTGGMVVVAKDGEIVYKYCHGYADNGKKLLVTEDSYFRLASVSKLISACAVMRLVDAHRLDLDEDIGQIIGGDKPYNAVNPSYPKTPLTSRMLMSHTSTIWDSNFAQKRPLREALKLVTSYYKNERPGTAYHYSNYGAGIMGIVLEAVTGHHLSQAVSELLFDPMGIDAAYAPQFLSHPDTIASSLAREYSEEIDLEHDYYLSYGGCWMKCTDLCRIGMMLCDYGMLEGTRYLEEDTVRDMIGSQKGKGGITVDSPYGLNVHRLQKLVPDRIIYGHQGKVSVNGSETRFVLCNMYFDPKSRFVFAMTTNVCSPGDTAYGVRPPAYSLFKLLWTEFVGPWQQPW